MFWSQFTVSFKHTPGQRIIHSINKNASPLATDAMTLMAYQFGDFRFYGTTQNIFFVWRLIISHIIRHCKFVLQGACTFLKKTQRHVLFKLEQRPEEEKTYRWNEFFHKLDNNRWKMHTGARVRKQSIYVSISLSIWKPFWKRVYIYIYICLDLQKHGYRNLLAKSHRYIYIYNNNNNNIDYSISWRIISSSSSYNSSSNRCNLCLKEKFLIICRPDLSSLNKRTELVSSCRHRNKALLRNN